LIWFLTQRSQRYAEGRRENKLRITVAGSSFHSDIHCSIYGLFGVRGSLKFGERSEVFVDFENIFDKSYRGISWGVDGAGRGVTLRYRYEF